MPQHRKRGNPHRFPKSRKRRQLTPTRGAQQRAPVPLGPPRAPSLTVRPVDPVERARLTLHDRDPITGNEDSLFYEFYRGYTIYSIPDGRCCIHSKHGCIKLRGKFVCLPDFEEAKTLIKQFRAEGYTSSDSVEWCLSEGESVWLNRREHQRRPKLSRPMQRAS
jgi:hypothetical protein